MTLNVTVEVCKSDEASKAAHELNVKQIRQRQI